MNLGVYSGRLIIRLPGVQKVPHTDNTGLNRRRRPAKNLPDHAELRLNPNRHIQREEFVVRLNGATDRELRFTMGRAAKRTTANRAALSPTPVESISQVLAAGKPRENFDTIQRIGLARTVSAGEHGNRIDRKYRVPE